MSSIDNRAETILQQTIVLAQQYFGEKLLSCYALGSLAHGGFSPLVSDIDIGIILFDPLTIEDSKNIDLITNQ